MVAVWLVLLMVMSCLAETNEDMMLPPEAMYATHAAVDLRQIRANLAGVRNRVGPTRKVLACVKADAYGHGAVAVASMIQSTGSADWFGVATVTEAVELRENGITLPILKLSPAFPGTEMDAALTHDITLSVCSMDNVLAIQQSAVRLGISRVRVHLKVDTGMRRVGVTPSEAPKLAFYIEHQCPNVSLQGVFTHFPTSDSAPGDNDYLYSEYEISQFKAVVELMQTTVLHRDFELVHAAASAGILSHPSAWFGMVRAGIIMYGHMPDPTLTPKTIQVSPALTWTTRVSFVKKVLAGETVGYGRTWVAERDTMVATMPVGYADGYDRGLSNVGPVVINGRRYVVTGRVCMDQLMVDLGNETTDVMVGDQVLLLGSTKHCKSHNDSKDDDEISAEELADLLDTNSYEITCKIGRRVPRIYLN